MQKTIGQLSEETLSVILNNDKLKKKYSLNENIAKDFKSFIEDWNKNRNIEELMKKYDAKTILLNISLINDVFSEINKSVDYFHNIDINSFAIESRITQWRAINKKRGARLYRKVQDS